MIVGIMNNLPELLMGLTWSALMLFLGFKWGKVGFHPIRWVVGLFTKTRS